MTSERLTIDSARRLCDNLRPRQVVRSEGNVDYYDYVQPNQPLTEKELLGVACNKKGGYLINDCVIENPELPCPGYEGVKKAVASLGPLSKYKD